MYPYLADGRMGPEQGGHCQEGEEKEIRSSVAERYNSFTRAVSV